MTHAPRTTSLDALDDPSTVSPGPRRQPLRAEFETELGALRESLLRMGSEVEAQIDNATRALRERDRDTADRVRHADRQLNELYRQIREQCLMVIATQQPVARDLRTLMGVVYISTELERMGDYAVRIARLTGTLCSLPDQPLRPE